jgi:hypothetical protein
VKRPLAPLTAVHLIRTIWAVFHAVAEEHLVQAFARAVAQTLVLRTLDLRAALAHALECRVHACAAERVAGRGVIVTTIV